MNPIFQIVIIAYLFFVVPILFGVLEAGIFTKERKTVSEIFTNGYLLMLALFWMPAVFLIKDRQPLSLLAFAWLGMILAVSVLALLVGRKQLLAMLADIKVFWSEKEAKGKWLLLGGILLSFVISIGFTKPDSMDATVEMVSVALETDTMYLHDAYSGYYVGYADEKCAISPIEMLYAVASRLAGLEADTFVYRGLPISLLLLFFLSIWRLGSVFFEKETQKIQFEFVAIVIYWMAAYMQGRALVTGMFLNCWNGVTLLSNIVLPLVFSLCLTWMKTTGEEGHKISAILEKIVLAVVCVMAGQLTHDKGGFYVGLMLFLCITVILVKGGHEYGITSGRFKKRV